MPKYLEAEDDSLAVHQFTLPLQQDMKKKGKISHACYVASLTFKSPVYRWTLKHLWHVLSSVFEFLANVFPPFFSYLALKTVAIYIM